jgi:menaquinone reductase, multiheme cytochrome c subunit
LEGITVSYKRLLLGIGGIVAGLVLGWLIFPAILYTSEPQPLHFSHKVHTGGKLHMTCETCHEFTVDGTFSGIPMVAKCSGCHFSRAGKTEAEKRLVEDYVMPKKEIPWKVYLRQPDNAFFPHAPHVKRAHIGCEECHGPHGQSDELALYQQNRLSGYSRDVWGRNIAGIHLQPWEGMKMDRCVNCHQSRNRVDGCVVCHK